MAKIGEKIERLERELKQARELQRRTEAKERAEASRRARALDTRQKILIGSVVQSRIDRGLIDAADLRAWLDADLTRAHDRAAFDLPPLQSSAPEPAADYQPPPTYDYSAGGG